MKPLNVGSLFSGIGGFDLGLERAGMHVSWQCEQDDFCRRVLARHWPDVPCYPDITELRANDVAPVDVLCGGFPCQDISVAGRGAGIRGERSGLWGEYARLIRELRPRYVVVENVSALLARGLDVVLADLAACGYDAEWDCLPASAFGAPHRRDRLWLVAYPSGSRRRQDTRSAPGDEGSDERWAAKDDHVADGDGQGCGEGHVADADRERLQADAQFRRDQASIFASGDESANDVGDPDGMVGSPSGSCSGRPQAMDEPGQVERALGSGGVCGDVQDADGSALQPWRVGGRAAQAGGAEWWAAEPPVGRVAHGVPDRLVQLAALGNALVPQIAEWLGRQIIDWEQEVAA